MRQKNRVQRVPRYEGIFALVGAIVGAVLTGSVVLYTTNSELGAMREQMELMREQTISLIAIANREKRQEVYEEYMKAAHWMASELSNFQRIPQTFGGIDRAYEMLSTAHLGMRLYATEDVTAGANRAFLSLKSHREAAWTLYTSKRGLTSEQNAQLSRTDQSVLESFERTVKVALGYEN